MMRSISVLAVVAALAFAGCQDDASTSTTGPSGASANASPSSATSHPARSRAAHCLDPIAAGQLGVDTPKERDPSAKSGNPELDPQLERGPFGTEAALDTDLSPGLRIKVSAPERFVPKADDSLTNIATGEYRQEFSRNRAGCPAYEFVIDLHNPTSDEEDICDSSFTIWDRHEEAMYRIVSDDASELPDCVDIAPGGSARYRYAFVAKDDGPFAIVVWRGGTHVFGDNTTADEPTGEGPSDSSSGGARRSIDPGRIEDPKQFAEAYFEAWKAGDEAALLAMTLDRFDVDSFPMRYPLSDTAKMTCEKNPGGSLNCEVLTGPGKATLVMYVAPANPTYDKWHIERFTLGSAE